jgi:endonuclease/exonuclease/phosphatase family metal-dependent hydrolase
VAHEIPPSGTFGGLTANVIAYSEAFRALVEISKQRDLGDEDWAPIEALVDVPTWERTGVFLTPAVETIDWPTYKGYVSQFAKHTNWEGTLRRVTESGDVVVLELEERNSRAGETDVSNTVTIYRFTPAGRIDQLHVYVAHLERRREIEAA